MRSYSNQPYIHFLFGCRPSVYSFLETVQMVGLSGKVFFSHGKRKEFSLDMIQLTEMGVKTAGEWDSKTGLNATYKPTVRRGRMISI